MNSDGIQTLVMKLRSVHLLPGRSFTRVDFFAPACDVWRTIFRFLENGFGTTRRRYKRGGLNQTHQVSNRNRNFQYDIGSGGGMHAKTP